MTNRFAPAAYTGSGTRGEAFARVAALLALGLSLGACSLSLGQVGSLVSEDKPTHSIARKSESPLSPELGPEDWRRARGALAVALDPQGNGSAVAWDNPETTLKGTFTPVGQPFVASDEICRAFLATLNGQASSSSLQGTACRLSAGEWVIRDVKPWRKPA